MSTALAFDTLQYAKRLKQAGFTDEQAEIQAEALSELIDERLATKLDLKELERGMKLEIKELERAMKEDTKELRREIKEMGYKITIKLGGIMIVGIAALGAFLTLINLALIKFLA